jgi:hypothetical protein
MPSLDAYDGVMGRVLGPIRVEPLYATDVSRRSDGQLAQLETRQGVSSSDGLLQAGA